MAASNQSVARIMRTDSLRRPSKELFPEQTPVVEELMRAQDPKFKGYDLILTNPPFAGDVGDQFSSTYELARGKGRKVERDVLFIERCLELLKPGGRMAMVLPYNKVGGDSWAYMRRWLIERMRIVAVVGLGRNTFMPHTSQKACVLVGVKRENIDTNFSREEVIFFISERDGKDRRGKIILKEDGGVVDHDLDQAVLPISKALCSHISRSR
jgi:type I restriction enzyme M protein